MKSRYLLSISIIALGLLSGCHDMYGDDDISGGPSYDDRSMNTDDQMMTDPQTSPGSDDRSNSNNYGGMSDDQMSDRSMSNANQQMSDNSSGDTEEVPFSETRRPGSTENDNVGAM